RAARRRARDPARHHPPHHRLCGRAGRAAVGAAVRRGAGSGGLSRRLRRRDGRGADRRHVRQRFPRRGRHGAERAPHARTRPGARVVPQGHLREAAELAYYGAKVLHPRALVPVIKRNVAIRIRPFAEPASLGTEISRRRTLEQYPVKALSAIPRQALLTVTGSGMLGVPGIAARTFAAVHQEGISVSLITQASSEHSICFSVPEESAQRARRSLEETFQLSKIGGGAVAHPERSDVVLLGFGQIGRALAP